LLKQADKNHKFLTKLKRPRHRPLVIAHRGDSFHAPENTREALVLGHGVGADACEIDVQLSRDLKVVVIHDDSLERTTDVAMRFSGDSRGLRGFPVREFDLDEIRGLDAGSWFLADPQVYRSASHFNTVGTILPEHATLFRGGSVRVPILVEILELVRSLDWLVNVEIKVAEEAQSSVLMELVMRDILETETTDRVLISSFDPKVVAEAARRMPRVATGLLTTSPIADPGRLVREVIGADAYHPSVEALGESSAIGLPVLVYTVNDASEGGLAEQLAKWPVDGLFTDDPGAVLARLDGRSDLVFESQ
jgi:glycerophosphoryl diester phosphodiesterase